MPITTLIESASGLRVIDYRCHTSRSAVPFVEIFDGFSLSYVERGSFGCTTKGAHSELLAGSLLVGRAGDEYQCSHEHHDGGDECLSFNWSASALDAIDVSSRAWASGVLPTFALPAPLTWLAALARIRAASGCALGLEEIALCLAQRFSGLNAGRKALPPMARLPLRHRRRIVEAALFIEAHYSESLGLEQLAAATSLSPFHFLRLFARVTGLTPHQYLLRTRLRRATALLANPDHRIGDIALEVGFGDLSNFIRTFHRACGMSPRRFRQLSHPERKICQDAWQMSP